jgi:hypothetical protein
MKTLEIRQIFKLQLHSLIFTALEGEKLRQRQLSAVDIRFSLCGPGFEASCQTLQRRLGDFWQAVSKLVPG